MQGPRVFKFDADTSGKDLTANVFQGTHEGAAIVLRVGDGVPTGTVYQVLTRWAHTYRDLVNGGGALAQAKNEKRIKG